jgi:myo-inositol-1(or 4)-monophosphatase
MREIAVEAARAGGAVLLANLDRQKTIEFKATGKYAVDPQVVSSVDREAEKKIVEVIRSACPDHSFLTEEAGQMGDVSEYTWIVDALDGTTQYVRRLPYFALSIALQQRDEVVLGVVYSPHLDELFVAEKGAGASVNGRRLCVSDVNDPDKALVASSAFGSYRVAERQDVFQKVLSTIRNLRIYGSPAIDLCYVADGRLDVRVTANTEPWDHPAGCLIVEEAGGRVTDWDGKPWSLDSTNLLATNGQLHALLLPLVHAVHRK